MEIDFHYYAIGFLARAAGFTKHHALTIAYASQYVDNATESEPIKVGEITFDPVRSAHKGLKMFSWGIQKKVYVPFHFIPVNPFDSSLDSFTYVTAPNSPFANLIFSKACQDRSGDELSRMISIGIALHTLADTWAHEGFSGVDDPVNDVEEIYQFTGNSWKHVLLENLYFDLLPRVGHAQAGHYPDYSYLRWKFTRDATKEHIERDNTELFLNAAATIYQLLVSLEKSFSSVIIPWQEIKPGILAILKYPGTDTEKRCDKWREFYQSVYGETSGYLYDAQQWRKEALSPQYDWEIAWDDYRPSDFGNLSFSMIEGFYETPWVKFHRAALRQRNFVLEHLL